MSQENAEPSLKDLLMVPDGPPDAVWLRALGTALSEGEIHPPDDQLTQPPAEDDASETSPDEIGSPIPSPGEDPEGHTSDTAGIDGGVRSWNLETDDGYGA